MEDTREHKKTDGILEGEARRRFMRAVLADLRALEQMLALSSEPAMVSVMHRFTPSPPRRTGSETRRSRPERAGAPPPSGRADECRPESARFQSRHLSVNRRGQCLRTGQSHSVAQPSHLDTPKSCRCASIPGRQTARQRSISRSIHRPAPAHLARAVTPNARGIGPLRAGRHFHRAI